VLKRACDLSSEILFRISETEGVVVWDLGCMGAYMGGGHTIYRHLGPYSRFLTIDGLTHRKLPNQN
jgi:hypothetical protein